jgi:hypothetical protein
MKVCIMQLFPATYYFYALGQNIFLGTQFSNIRNLHSSLSVRGPYKTTSNIIVLYVFMF